MQLSVGHVGDSRLLLTSHRGSFQQLTSDHSLVAEQVPSRHLNRQRSRTKGIYKAFAPRPGNTARSRSDIEQVPLFPGDVFTPLPDASHVWSPSRKLLELFRRSLILSAPLKSSSNTLNEGGGIDNVSVIVVSLKPEPQGWFSWLRRGARNLQSEMVPLEVTDWPNYR